MVKEESSGADLRSLVFALNLLAPLGFAVLIARGAAWIGVAAAILLMLLLWLRLCATSDRVSRALEMGGWLLVFTQLFPVLQFIAGSVGVAMGDTLGLESLDWTVQRATGGFVATITTGGILIGIAALCGGVASRLLSRRPRERAAIGSPLFDRELDG